jgi:hypothetical protein
MIAFTLPLPFIPFVPFVPFVATMAVVAVAFVAATIAGARRHLPTWAVPLAANRVHAKRGKNGGNDPHNEEDRSQAAVKSELANGLQKTRRDRDSNPSGTCAPTGFRNRRLQPLSHLSK